MKMFGYFMAVAIVAMSALAHRAEACSMIPVNVGEQVHDLQRYVATALKIEPSALASVEVSAASGDYIWTDPMCPEGLQASATFTVELKNSDPLAAICKTVVKVDKTEPTRLSKIPVKHVINIEIVQREKCRE